MRVPILFSLEERARLGEDEALRRHFDAQNLRTLAWLSVLALLASLGLELFSLVSGRVVSAILVLGAILLSAGCALALRPRFAGRSWVAPLADLAARRSRSFTIAWLLILAALLYGAMLGTDAGPIAVALFLGYFYIGIRLAPVETIFVYGAMAAALVVEGLLAGRALIDGPNPIFASIVNLAIALAISLFVSRRRRLGFLTEWREHQAGAREQIRMRDELELARSMQLSMLPRESPDVPWLEIASLSLPATEVGGDYYDYFPLGPSRFAVVAGDVAGHGLASGMVLSGIRACLTLMAEEMDRPEEVLGRLQKMLRQTGPARMLVTLSILVLDRETGTATLTSAGHPPLFILRAGGSVERVETRSLPLGTRLGGTFDRRQLTFGPGDVFLLQTDGLYESESESGALYGFDRLELVLESCAGSGPGAIRETVLRDLWSFRGEAAQRDDVTMVVIRVG